MGDELKVLKHKLVPKQVLLNEEQKKKLLENLQIIPNQLPKILVKDPVAKALGAKEGDIIKIIRESQTSGNYIYYRVVVKS